MLPLAVFCTSLCPQVEEKPEGEEGDEVILNIKPMQPLVRTSQYGYMRGLGLHQARTVPPSLHVSRLGKSRRPPLGRRVGYVHKQIT